jgi:hypothetical protein
MNPSLLGHYNSIKYFNHADKIYSINREHLKSEFEWLYNHIDKLDHFAKYDIVVKDDIYKSLIKEKYEQFLIYIRQLPRINLLIMEYKNRVDYGDEYAAENTVHTQNNQDTIDTFLKNMEINFNNYIYDYNINLPGDVASDWYEYYNVILFVFHLITTHLDEIEFDLFATNLQPVLSV